MEDPALLLFVNTWVGEFSTAIEMFSGRRTEVRYTHQNEAAAPADALWLEQSFGKPESFKVWIGSPEKAWTSLGRSLGEESPEGIRSTYLEIVGQAQQSTAGALGTQLGKVFHCDGPAIVDKPQFDSSECEIFDIVLQDREPSSLFLAVERIAGQIIEPDLAAQPALQEAQPLTPEESGSALYSDVMNLRLPVAISVGRGEMEMRTALNAEPGSVMILPTSTDELAELVVHGKVVARGQIVVAKGNYGLRITQIVSRHERMITSAEK